MKRHVILFACCLFVALTFAQTTPTIYIDGNGVMRWSHTRKEASFFGTNYTLPFAHAYRAIGYLGMDHKAAIDKDVYHFARLDFNAYRIHVWDVEISDAQGNLIVNEHLELLDYLIAKLQERGIRTVITTQTNFGNGYPERSQPTGGFSYNYDKCSIHSNPEAIAAQERYIANLVQHVNTYTHKAYMNDPYIVGFEINNEPCHSGTQTETKAYINRMLAALKQAGNKKPVFYNVSHNGQQIEAYYDTAIQGTTYQWYPIGLVAGHTRQGNFLPYVDHFDIPFSNTKGFGTKARLVYECDPADIMYSYMYPAMARTFRKAGFQWITQFAYDPIDMAFANTEYQTHFLNLAYTPGKALSMKIAAEAAYTLPRNRSYGAYPADTLFGNFHVSHAQDLSELNTKEKFYYSNQTKTIPAAATCLESVAGCGNSPVVTYEGTGAYFIDKLENGIWRLEVMPDAIQVNDPFAKPSLEKEVVRILWSAWDMALHLPNLGTTFTIKGMNEGNTIQTETQDGILRSLQPGVYLLSRQGSTPTKTWNADSSFGNIRLGEFVAPQPKANTGYTVTHQPQPIAEAGKTLTIEAVIASSEQPDSVIIYTDKVSFWNDQNPSIKMERTKGYTYQAILSGEEVKEGTLKYNIIVCLKERQQTFPAGVAGTPLNWDYTANPYWETKVVATDSAISLFEVTDEYSGIASYSVPEWNRVQRKLVANSPTEKQTLHIAFDSQEAQPSFFLQKYIREKVTNRKGKLSNSTTLCLHLKQVPERLKVGFRTTDGYTYHMPCTAVSTDGIARLPLSALKQTDTALLPHAYPVFLGKYFRPNTEIPFDREKIELLELSFEGKEIEIGSIWLE